MPIETFVPSKLGWSTLDKFILIHDHKQEKTYKRDNGNLITFPKHPPYEICQCEAAKSIRRDMENGGSELPPEKIENADEYTKIFNEDQIEVSKLKDEEVLQRIITLETVIRQARTRVQSANFNLNERKKKMTREQKEALAIQDRAYRVKPEEVRPERKQPMSKDDKAIAEIMKLLKLDYSAAKKWIDDNG